MANSAIITFLIRRFWIGPPRGTGGPFDGALLASGVAGFFPSSLDHDARAAGGPGFDFERDLENLFEQFTLIDSGGRCPRGGPFPVHQDKLVGAIPRPTRNVGDP